MNRKMKWAIAVAILFLFASFFVTSVYERPYRNALFEMRIDAPRLVWGNNHRTYRFVVLNSGTLISYSGIRIDSPTIHERFDLTMWPIVRRRSRISLNDEDFQNISRMASIIADGNVGQLRIMSMWQMELLLDGNIYRGGTEIYLIADELLRLSPLTNERFYIDSRFLEEFDRD